MQLRHSITLETSSTMFGQYYKVLHSTVLLHTTKYNTVLIRTTKCYSVLRSTTKYDSVLHSTTTDYYSILQSTTPYHKVLHNTTPYYTVLLRTTKYYTVLLRTTKYYPILLRTTQYYKVLHSTTPYRAPRAPRARGLYGPTWAPAGPPHRAHTGAGPRARTTGGPNPNVVYLELWILLMERILHQLIGSLSHYLQGLDIPGGAGFLPSTVSSTLL